MSGLYIQSDSGWLFSQFLFLLLHRYIRQTSHHHRLQSLQMGWQGFFFSLLVWRRVTFSIMNTQSVEVKTLLRHELDFSVFNEINKSCFQQQLNILALHYVSHNWAVNILDNSLSCFGTFSGTFWPRTLLHITHSQHWRCHLMAEDVQLGFVSIIIW